MKLRKPAAVFMAGILAVTTLAACGSKENNPNTLDKKETKISSFQEALEEGLKLDKYSYNAEIYMNLAGTEIIDLDEEMAAVLGIDNLNEIKISMNIAGKTTGNAGETTVGFSLNNDALKAELIKAVYVDDAIYVSTKTLLDGISGLAGDISGEELPAELEDMLPDGDYLKITTDMLMEILNYFPAGTITDDMYIFGIDPVGTADNAKNSAEFAKYILELIDEGIKEGAKDAYTKDGNTFKLTINNGNIDGIADGIAEVIKEKSGEICEKFNDYTGEELLDKSSLELVAATLKAYDMAALMEDIEFEFVMSTSYVDDTWTFNISMSVEEDGNKAEFGMNYTARKDDALKISAPTDVISDEDTEAVMGLLEMGMDDIGYDYDDYDWDDYDYDDFSDYDDSSDKYASIKDYIESDEFKDEFDAMIEASSSEDMTMSISGEGNRLIYAYRYTDVYEENEIEIMREYFEEAMSEESMGAAFSSIAEELSLYIDVDNPIVVVKYLNGDGTLIYSHEYTAD